MIKIRCEKDWTLFRTLYLPKIIGEKDLLGRNYFVGLNLYGSIKFYLELKPELIFNKQDVAKLWKALQLCLVSEDFSDMYTKNTAKRNMSSAVCASSMYSRLCIKMPAFLFVRACAMLRMLYLSCGIPFPV